ncbi:ABC transporter permease [Devriesea agamarum]|uniref:ABC transporter permease n=1 Tax=Devriesea agamarum TaxID=472569 RepID=UPI00071E19C0|nr:ABC-2 family transporter protein [Devriesea agamarum]
MSAYWHLASASFRQHSTYRLATAAGATTNIVFGFIRASILLAALGTAGGEINGYNAAQAMTYVWLGQGLIAPLEVFGTNHLATRVKSGEVAMDLLRPVHFLGMFYAQKLGRSAFLLISRGLPPMLVGMILTGIALPESPWSYPLGLLSILLAVTVTFLADAMVNMAAFWVVETRGLSRLYITVMNLLSGHLVPIAWFPTWMYTIASFTPFPSMVQIPIDTLSGRVSPIDSLTGLGIQALWVLVLAGAAHWMLRLGTRSLEVQGG